jgi:hypothetical protein
MKTAIYDPVNRSLLNVQRAPFHHRETIRAAADFVAMAREKIGRLPGVAFCVWDESSIRIYPMNPDEPPTFDEVAKACGGFGYVAG